MINYLCDYVFSPPRLCTIIYQNQPVLNEEDKTRKPQVCVRWEDGDGYFQVLFPPSLFLLVVLSFQYLPDLNPAHAESQ